MKKELHEEFNRKVEGYRKDLLTCARKSEWDSFKAKAGRLFDYVESIEFSELEKKFFKVFYSILAVLGLACIMLFGFDFGLKPEFARLKTAFVFSALAGSTFALYFFLNFRAYMDIKMSYYKQRRENFIRDIQRDFIEYARMPDNNRA